MRFVPLLAGASLPDRLRASLGAVVGTLLTAAVCLVAQPL
ncbi:MAG: HPP family protein, partial [Mesorhizobium amorphae]